MKPKKVTAGPRAVQPEIVIITGLSGSGKGTVLKALEDVGYYAVDNLPVDLIPTFADLTIDSPNITRAALVVDIREGFSLHKFPAILESIRRRIAVRLLFLEADDAVLVRRYSETRRPHPLGVNASVETSVREERKELEPIRKLADLEISTSKFTVHELRDYIKENFSGSRPEDKIRIYVNSFGFRHGVPNDSDLLFDVRFLPNPNYVPEFRHLTGRNAAVAKYIRGYPQTVEFIARISDLLIYLLPHYIQEGKSYLTISFGCTGGHHRSVFIADQIKKRLERAGFRASVNHRDLALPV